MDGPQKTARMSPDGKVAEEGACVAGRAVPTRLRGSWGLPRGKLGWTCFRKLPLPPEEAGRREVLGSLSRKALPPAGRCLPALPSG